MFTRSVENRGFLHASRFETDQSSSLSRDHRLLPSTATQPRHLFLYLFFFFLSIGNRSNRGETFPVSAETDPAGTSDGQPLGARILFKRLSTLVTRSTKADGRSARERGRGARERKSGGTRSSGRPPSRLLGSLASDRRGPDTDQKNVCQRMRTGNVEEERGCWIR